MQSSVIKHHNQYPIIGDRPPLIDRLAIIDHRLSCIVDRRSSAFDIDHRYSMINTHHRSIDRQSSIINHRRATVIGRHSWITWRARTWSNPSSARDRPTPPSSRIKLSQLAPHTNQPVEHAARLAREMYHERTVLVGRIRNSMNSSHDWFSVACWIGSLRTDRTRALHRY